MASKDHRGGARRDDGSDDGCGCGSWTIALLLYTSFWLVMMYLPPMDSLPGIRELDGSPPCNDDKPTTCSVELAGAGSGRDLAGLRPRRARRQRPRLPAVPWRRRRRRVLRGRARRARAHARLPAGGQEHGAVGGERDGRGAGDPGGFVSPRGGGAEMWGGAAGDRHGPGLAVLHVRRFG